MPGLVPGIHDFASMLQAVGGRDKPGHDSRKSALLRGEFPKSLEKPGLDRIGGPRGQIVALER
jgi:hypothetical protein